MLVPEEDVLEAKNDKIKDSDHWPSYSLKRTRVLSQNTGEPMSLFAANIDNPAQVLGTLETVDQSCKKYLKNDKYRSKTIQLLNVTNYAFAEYDDGSYGFWAAGRAGWFELRDPAPAFKKTYEGMSEACSMFYTMADKLRRAHGPNPKIPLKGLERYANTVFKDYQLHGSNSLRRVDVDDVREGFHQHREFIITCMLEAQEGLDWEASAIFNYFKRKFPDTVAGIQSRMAGNKRPHHPGAASDGRGKRSKPDNVTGNGEASGRTVTRKPASRKPLKEATIKDANKDDDSLSTSPEDDGPETPSPKSSLDNGSHKRKSILQPKGSKYSKKAAKSRGKLPANDEADVNDSSDEGNKEGASPLATAAARDTSTLANHTQVQPKKQHSSALDDYASYHTYLPRPEKKKVLVSYTLPSTTPQGPGDIWTCTWEGCNKRVHAGSTEEGQAEVEEHLKAHKSSAEEKIQLAMTESRPYLPVGNLVAHLQARQNNDRTEATHGGAPPGVKFPKPIVRSKFFH